MLRAAMILSMGAVVAPFVLGGPAGPTETAPRPVSVVAETPSATEAPPPPLFFQTPTQPPRCLIPAENAQCNNPKGCVNCDGYRNADGEQMKGFGSRNLRVSRTEQDQVFLQYGLSDVPCDGRYVVRFWPKGRNNSPPLFEDFDLGQLKAGGSKSGELGPYKIPGITAKTTLRYNLDIDVWPDERTFKQFSARSDFTQMLGQCDRGGSVTVEPPPPPTNGGVVDCICHVDDLGNQEDVCGNPAVNQHKNHMRDREGRCHK